MAQTGQRGNLAGRGEALAILIICALFLTGSFMLRPNHDASGIAQIPFTTCLFRNLTGLPCPLCGLTTAFTLMSRGRVLTAFHCHILGPTVYALTWLGLLAGLWGMITGRRVIPRWLRTARAAKIIIGVLVVGWAINLTLHLLR